VGEAEGYSRRVRDPKALQDIRNDKIAYLDRAIALINDDKYGSMFEAKRRVTAMQDETNLQMNTSPIGEWMRQRATLNEKLGPAWSNYLDSLGLQKTGLQQLQSFFNDTQFRASVSDDVRKDGVVKSMYSDLVAAQKAKANGVKAPDKIFDNLVENVNLLITAQTEGKEDVAKEVVKYTFDPNKNMRIVEFFGRDFTDDKGNFHKGKFAVYDTLTSPRVVDSIAALRDKEAWSLHKQWQEISFKTLFGEEVQNLQKIQGDASMPLKIKWDSDNNQIIPEFGKPKTTVEANYIRWADQSIKDLNRGIQNLRYMHNKEGGDSNAYVFDMLMTLGYSPNDKLHGDNLPQKVMDSIAASSKSNKKRIEDAFRASQGLSE
jgi:hypothetical protein